MVVWAFFGLLAAIAVLEEIIVPDAIRSWLIAGVHASSATSELRLGRVQLSLFPPALTLLRIQLLSGDPRSTFVHAQADRVVVPFAIRPLFSRQIRLGRIQIERPEVNVIEGDVRMSGSKTTHGGSGGIDLEVQGADVAQGFFSYTRAHLQKRAVVRVSRITAVIGPVGSSNRVSHRPAVGRATGLLEDSGTFVLSAGADFFAETPHVNVALELTSLNLADLNRFFMPDDDVQLGGRLIHGRSAVSIRGRRLTASVYARFRGLDIKIRKNADRSALSAFFQNTLVSLKMGKQNVASDQFDRRGTVTLTRKPRQTVLSFILTGMRDASFKVASKGGR